MMKYVKPKQIFGFEYRGFGVCRAAIKGLGFY